MILAAVLLLSLLALPVSAQDKDWENEWSRVLSEAKKEGKVVVAGSSDPAIRRDLPVKFKGRFGITVEYIGGRSGDVVGRLRTEQQAGAYNVDVVFSGIQALATILYPEKMLDPLRPALILPEVLDPAKWKKGKLWFMDPEERYVLRLANTLQQLFFFNSKEIKREELSSMRDLLNPKWKGKISVFDPTVPGSGSNTAARLYAQWGEEFVRKLYVDQKPAFSRDGRQLADWLARGTHPISLNAPGGQVQEMQKEGFPIVAVYSLPDAPGSTNGSSGLVVLMQRAPHPNAARIFVNWIASREGVQFLTQATRWAPTRNDVDESIVPPEEVPRPGVRYFDSYDWDFTVTTENKVRARMKEILKPGQQ